MDFNYGNSESVLIRRPVASAATSAQPPPSPEEYESGESTESNSCSEEEESTMTTDVASWTVTVPFNHPNGLRRIPPRDERDGAGARIPKNSNTNDQNMTDQRWHLLNYDDIPEWLKDNHFIQGMYRPELRSLVDCIRSIFVMHNETVNIWTHMLPALLSLCMLWNWLSEASTMDLEWEEYIIMLGFHLGAVLCFSFSTMYHTLSCHSMKVLQIFLKFDYAGIIFMVFGSYFAWVYYAYQCHVRLRIIYYSIGICVASGVSGLSITRFFDSAENRSLRAVVFVLMVASCFTAIFHYYLIYGLVQIFEKAKFGYIMYTSISYGLGGFIYATRIPERFFPGRFNVLGHSHQIFHVCVVCGALIYYKGIMGIFENRDEIPVCEIE